MNGLFKIKACVAPKRSILFIFTWILFTAGICQAQFVDHFDGQQVTEWEFYTGDGEATVDFVQKDGYARIIVDATEDAHNVWWAIVKQNVASNLDMAKLEHPDYELRVEAKVRLSHAPRRLNFMVNTQRTTDFHKQLKEYDIPDTSNWHVISMTTKDLDAVPGDALNVQLGVTDWGLGKYHVDVDYYRADIVNIHQAGPDKGEPLTYHPPVPELDHFSNHLSVAHDALINRDFPDVNFNEWHSGDAESKTRILSVNANQWAILRWDFEQFKQAEVEGAGLLELTTYSVAKGGNYIDVFGEDLGVEFGKVRIIEIFGGNPFWEETTVTFNNLIRGKDLSEVFNGQMIFDTEVVEKNGSKNFITISRPVMQRLLDGETKGLLIKPLGAINASFYASENNGNEPKLHFNISN